MSGAEPCRPLVWVLVWLGSRQIGTGCEETRPENCLRASRELTTRILCHGSTCYASEPVFKQILQAMNGLWSPSRSERMRRWSRWRASERRPTWYFRGPRFVAIASVLLFNRPHKIIMLANTWPSHHMLEGKPILSAEDLRQMYISVLIVHNPLGRTLYNPGQFVYPSKRISLQMLDSSSSYVPPLPFERSSWPLLPPSSSST